MKAFLSYLWMIEIREIKYDSELPIGVGKNTYIFISHEFDSKRDNLFDRFF